MTPERWVVSPPVHTADWAAWTLDRRRDLCRHQELHLVVAAGGYTKSVTPDCYAGGRPVRSPSAFHRWWVDWVRHARRPTRGSSSCGSVS